MDERGGKRVRLYHGGVRSNVRYPGDYEQPAAAEENEHMNDILSVSHLY